MNEIKKLKKISSRQEQKAAKELGGKVMPASGALDFSKSDVRVPGELRLECKFTNADTYTLKLSDLIKIRNEAVRKFEAPVFQVEFKGKNKGSYAIVPRDSIDLEETPFDFFEIPVMTTYNKSITLYSGDLLSMVGKASPLIIIGFDRIPHAKKMEFAIYEWNDYIAKRRLDVSSTTLEGD